MSDDMEVPITDIALGAYIRARVVMSSGMIELLPGSPDVVMSRTGSKVTLSPADEPARITTVSGMRTTSGIQGGRKFSITTPATGGGLGAWARSSRMRFTVTSSSCINGVRMSHPDGITLSGH